MEKFVKRLAAASSLGVVWPMLSPYFALHGFGAWSYFALSNGPYPKLLKEEGFPESWVEKYKAEDLEKANPIPPFSMANGRVVRWSQIANQLNLSAAQREFIQSLESSKMTDGIAVPAYGPQGHHAIIGLGMIEDNSAFDAVPEMRAVAQALHIKVIELTTDVHYPSLLSPREIEVLCWVARGKSNLEIAMILSISADTVSTHIRRIFAKLCVSDRTSAAVKGIRMGLGC